MPIKDRSDITVERRFDVKRDITEDWFCSYASELAKYGGQDKDDVQCDIRLGSDFDNRVGFRNRQAWMDYVTTHWVDIAETNIWQYGGLVRRGLCNHRRQHLVLMLVADNMADIERTFELLREALSLSISPEDPYRYRRSSLEFEIGYWRPDLYVVGIKAIAALLGPNPEVSQAWAKSFEGDIEKLTPFFNLKSFCGNVGMRASRFGEIAI